MQCTCTLTFSVSLSDANCSVSQHPKSATLRFHHALALVKCRYFEESELEFSNAIKLNGNNAQIYHEFAKFCERHRQPPDYEKATDLYFKACKTDPIHFLGAAVDAANLMRRLDTKPSRASAMQLFEKLVVDAPHLNGAYLGFAKLLLREKQYDRVRDVLLDGLRHHPTDRELKQYFEHFQSLSTARSSVIAATARPSVLYQPVNSNNTKPLITMTTSAPTPASGSGSGSGSGSASKSGSGSGSGATSSTTAPSPSSPSPPSPSNLHLDPPRSGHLKSPSLRSSHHRIGTLSAMPHHRNPSTQSIPTTSPSSTRLSTKRSQSMNHIPRQSQRNGFGHFSKDPLLQNDSSATTTGPRMVAMGYNSDTATTSTATTATTNTNTHTLSHTQTSTTMSLSEDQNTPPLPHKGQIAVNSKSDSLSNPQRRGGGGHGHGRGHSHNIIGGGQRDRKKEERYGLSLILNPNSIPNLGPISTPNSNRSLQTNGELICGHFQCHFECQFVSF